MKSGSRKRLVAWRFHPVEEVALSGLKFLVSGDTSADSTTSGCVPILELAAALDVLEPGLVVLDVVDEPLLQAATASTASAPKAQTALRGILVGCIVHSVCPAGAGPALGVCDRVGVFTEWRFGRAGPRPVSAPPAGARAP